METYWKGTERRGTILSRLKLESGTSSEFERDAEIFNACHAAGIKGPRRDFLLCAVVESRKLALFTTDKDFSSYTNHCKMELHFPKAIAVKNLHCESYYDHNKILLCSVLEFSKPVNNKLKMRGFCNCS
jgi:hypothetical protein